MYLQTQPARRGRLGILPLRPRRRLRRLGAIDPGAVAGLPSTLWQYGTLPGANIIDWLTGQCTPGTTLLACSAALDAANASNYVFVPGGGVGGVVYNAATGDVSPAQKAALVQQGAASLVAAGADPGTAAAQAESDVSDTLDTFSGPGAFGVTWTGANPATNAVGSTGSWLADNWAWLALGGVGIVWLAGRA